MKLIIDWAENDRPFFSGSTLRLSLISAVPTVKRCFLKSPPPLVNRTYLNSDFWQIDFHG